MFDPSHFRDYQLEGISAIWRYFHDYRDPRENPLVAMPTASGKSWVIAGFVQSVFDQWAASRVMAVTHDETLIKQNLAKLLHVWPGAPAGVYSAGMKRREHLMPITFAGIQSIHNKAALFGPVDLLIIDEAHLVSPKQQTMYRKLIDQQMILNPYMRVIGLSATCYRLGLGRLTDNGIFTHICYDLTTPEEYAKLIAAGWLCPLIAKRTEYRINIEGVHIRGGEFVESEQQAAVNKREVTQAVLEECWRLAHDRSRWLLFATGVDHANDVAELANAMGIPTVPIHSKLPGKVREYNYSAFASGAVRVAVAMNAMTTGVDIPEIDFIGMLRHTNSPALWVQMLGRGGRVAPWVSKRNCLVADFTTNTARLGPINDPVLPRPPGAKTGQPAPTKECPVCSMYLPPSVRVCEFCGYIFPEKVNFGTESSGLDVMKLSSLPEVGLWDVDHIIYTEHKNRRKGGLPSLMVSYCCGMARAREFICFEHVGTPRARAERWWQERTSAPIPATVQEAIAAKDRAQDWRAPKRVRVWIKEPYPEILDHIYD